MRVHFTAPKTCRQADLEKMLNVPAKRFNIQYHLHTIDQPMRVLVMVSKTDHCLNDLLYRWRIGALPIEITRIVSNHATLKPLADQYNIAFSHLPVTKESKSEQEQILRTLIAQDQADLIVLARYMQVLSDPFAVDYFGQIINIHHSFLPGFKGARPYHRAHQRGVKLIGATAHYVTGELDEGPIIEQETERVHHGMSVKDFIGAGRDIERRVLSRAVRYHSERRVLLNGRKTVIFM